MHFTEFIRLQIQQLLGNKYPIYFYWDRHIIPDHEYVVYQTEDLDVSDKLNHDYQRLLDGSVKIYEYSEKNLEFLDSEFKPFLPELNKPVDTNEKEFDVLFYGLVTSRRQQIIDNLNYDVIIKDNLTYDEMQDLIQKSKYVLSIGSYSNVHNDLLRVTPALNLGANILLERTKETWYDEFLIKHFNDRITFI